LQQFARQQQIPFDVLEAAGLWRQGREPFAQRLMFPIEDERGRVVGFGGRLVPGAPGSDGDGDYKPPKYLNSPESPFFNKRRVLFGLHRAKLAGERRIVVMEGYTDVIACHLAGFQGAVASLGTAFTADHARTLERYATAGLVLMFDADRAGLQAAERAARELVNSRLPVRIALMGDADGAAKDPAEVVVARVGEDPELVAERRARFADVLDGAEDWLAVWFRLLGKRLDLSQAVHVESAARECAALLGLIQEPVRQSAMLQQMARHLAVPAPTLERMLQKQQQRQRARPNRDEGDHPAGAERTPPPAPSTPLQRAEVELLACMLARPNLLVHFDPADSPGDADYATLLAWATDGLALGRSKPAELFRYLFARAAEQPRLQAVLSQSHERAQKLPDAEAVFHGLIAGRRRLGGEALLRQWRRELQDALAIGDRERSAQLQAQILGQLRVHRPRPPRDAGPVRAAQRHADPPAAPDSS
jgi:DNA primase